MVDFFGDRALIRPVLDQTYEQSGPLMRTVLRWNWAYRPLDPVVPMPRYQLHYTHIGVPAGRVVRAWPVPQQTSQAPVTTLVLIERRRG